MTPSEAVEKRRDIDPFPSDPRHAAAAMALQLHAGFDPDSSKTAARYVVQAVLRAGVRPTDGLPTAAECNRARSAAARRAIDLTHDEAYAILFAALCEEGHP